MRVRPNGCSVCVCVCVGVCMRVRPNGCSVCVCAQCVCVLMAAVCVCVCVRPNGCSVCCVLQGSDLTSMDMIPEPIKEATALFSGSSPQVDLPQGQMDSLLSIISSQREGSAQDRELEAWRRTTRLNSDTESRTTQQTLLALQTELDSLRADNIKLYEKIKFLQSYAGRAGSSDDRGAFSSRLKKAGPFSSLQQKRAVLRSRLCWPYRRSWTASAPTTSNSTRRSSSCRAMQAEELDPFSSFPAEERQRRYLNLSPWDKATLSLGRVILSSKTARTVASFLHLSSCTAWSLLVLYKTAWSESIGRDCAAFCAKKYSDHLHRFHEDGGNGDMWQ
ncbi:hypothetical protein AALO_G00207330 [Alosa alosa]|uniref:CASP C-terminal domain-containing protein n=1 Tax=Alosa alosa TaxID=278164 RepID=A0AAV6FYX3_9TELE|nr:hypothetical protein AALO_G00207330 [Alosa alosa]